MSKLENKIKEVVPDGTPLFDSRNYQEKYFTQNLKKDDECFIITRLLTRNTVLLLQCKVTDKHTNCMQCPLVKYNCNGIACNLSLIKIYRI